MEWINYMIMAANHSKGSAAHWFRYLRKYVDKCGVLFSVQDIDMLSENEALTPFQRISLKAAFKEGSVTNRYIISLNSKASQNKIKKVREKYENIKTVK
jgi:hypothetical protein